MPTKQQGEQHKDEQADKRQGRVTAIGNHVLRALGQPGNLQRVQVRPLWADCYRVNVLVGIDAASVRIAHSYFLVTDSDGNFLRCAPEITKQY